MKNHENEDLIRRHREYYGHDSKKLLTDHPPRAIHIQILLMLTIFI